MFYVLKTRQVVTIVVNWKYISVQRRIKDTLEMGDEGSEVDLYPSPILLLNRNVPINAMFRTFQV